MRQLILAAVVVRFGSALAQEFPSEDWEWSSLKPSTRSAPPGLLQAGPLSERSGWTNYVNGVESAAELEAIRRSIARGGPFGAAKWQEQTASSLGLKSSLRPRGRLSLGSAA